MLMQLVYASRPFGFDAPTLAGILLSARRRNPALDVTGALLCRADLYLQLLEGPPAAIERLYDDIRRDDRHIEVTELVRRTVAERMFPGWAMRDDPAEGVMWSPDAVHQGAPTSVGDAEVLAIFQRLAADPSL